MLLRGSTADLQRTLTTVDRLVPRRMVMLGLIAGPLLIARFVGILFGVFEPMSVLGGIMVAPEFTWELSLGIWLIVKGVNPSAMASLSTNTDDGVFDRR